MAVEYAEFRRRKAIKPLIYGFLDINNAKGILSASDLILTLEVPDEWAMVSKHAPWSAEILAGQRVVPEGNPEDIAQARVISKKETWKTIFNVDGYEGTVQVVFDRINRIWVLDPDLTKINTAST
jgi:hypothetical protein